MAVPSALDRAKIAGRKPAPPKPLPKIAENPVAPKKLLARGIRQAREEGKAQDAAAKRERDRRAAQAKTGPRTVTVTVAGKTYTPKFDHEPTSSDIASARLYYLRTEHPAAFKAYTQAREDRKKALKRGDTEGFRKANQRAAAALDGKAGFDQPTGSTSPYERFRDAVVPGEVTDAVQSGFDHVVGPVTKRVVKRASAAVAKGAQKLLGDERQKGNREGSLSLTNNPIVNPVGSLIAGAAKLAIETDEKLQDPKGEGDRIVRSVGSVLDPNSTLPEKVQGTVEGLALLAPVAGKLAGPIARGIETGIAAGALRGAERGSAGLLASATNNPAIVRRGISGVGEVGGISPALPLPTRAAAPKVTPSVQEAINTHLRPTNAPEVAPLGKIVAPEGLEATGRFSPEGKPILRQTNPQAEPVAPNPIAEPPATKIALETPAKPTTFTPSNAGTAADRDALGLAELPQAERKTIAETFAEGAELDVADVQLKARSKQVLNAAEVGALGREGARLKGILAESAPNSPEYAAALRKFDDLTETLKTAGTEQGRALNARRMLVTLFGKDEFEVGTVVARAKTQAERAGAKLSPDAEKTIRQMAEDHRSLQQQIDDLQAGRVSLESEVARLRAGRTARSTVRKERIAQFEKDAAAAWEEYAGVREDGIIELSANFNPNQAKALARYFQARVKATGLKAADVVDEIVTRLKTQGVEATAAEVRIALGNGLRDLRAPKQGPITAEQAANRAAQREVDSVLKPAGPKLGPNAPKAPQLGPTMRDHPTLAEGRAIGRKSAVEGQIADAEAALTGKTPLENGIPATRPKVPDTVEMRALLNRRDKLRGEIRRTIAAQANAADTPAVKAAKVALATYGDIRSIGASSDFSYAARQGALLSIDTPGSAKVAFGEAIRSLKEDAYLEIQRGIVNDAEFDTSRLYGLHYDDVYGSFGGASAEDFATKGLLSQTPGIKQALGASERNMAAGLNRLRLDAWKRAVAQFPNATEDELRDIARYLNAATGRGSNLPGIAGRRASAILFSPRFLSSRFIAPAYIFNTGPAGRIARRQFGKALTTYTTVAGAAVAAGATVSLDPESADFLKIKVGDTRIDPGAGFTQVVRLFAQGGNVARKKLGGAKIDRNRDIVQPGTAFLQYKTSPQVGVPLELLTGETAVGEARSPGQTALNSVLPIGVSSALQTGKEYGPLSKENIGTVLGNLIGLNVNSYKPKEGQKPRPVGPSIPIGKGAAILPTPVKPAGAKRVANPPRSRPRRRLR